MIGTSVEVIAGGSVEIEKGTYSVTSKGTSNISSLTFDVSSVTTETTTETTTQTTTTTTTTETTTETTTAFPIVTVDLTQEAGVNLVFPLTVKLIAESSLFFNVPLFSTISLKA